MAPTLIRRTTAAEDLAWCAHLMAASEPWVTLGRTVEASRRLLGDPTREVYLAEAGGIPVGFVIVAMGGVLTGFIQTVCVAHARRGSGLGTELVAFAEARIFRESPNVFLCVSSFNRRARRLYQRLGYVLVGPMVDFLVPGHDELLFRKSLAPASEFVAARP
jgi:[ribosomal protein S18]-alanine N-acetyltransferase